MEDALAMARAADGPFLVAPGALRQPAGSERALPETPRAEKREAESAPLEMAAVREESPAPPGLHEMSREMLREVSVAAEPPVAEPPEPAAEVVASPEPLPRMEEIEEEPSDSFQALSSRAMAWLASRGATLGGALLRASQTSAIYASRLGRIAGKNAASGARSSQAWLGSQAPRLRTGASVIRRSTALVVSKTGVVVAQLGRSCISATQAAIEAAQRLRLAHAARRREREAARRAAVTVAQSAKAPEPLSSDLVWHSRTVPVLPERRVASRSGGRRRRDWEVALAGGALGASLLMLAFGLFGTPSADSHVSAAVPVHQQKIAGAATQPTLSHPKTNAVSVVALPQSDAPLTSAAPAQQRMKQSQRANPEPDDFGDEVVVRHFTPVKPVQTRDGVKHISDSSQ